MSCNVKINRLNIGLFTLSLYPLYTKLCHRRRQPKVKRNILWCRRCPWD